jgi:hypothetical protein
MNMMSYNFIYLKHIKTWYLTVKDPLTLWNNVRERYEYQKTIILPKTRSDWMKLNLHISCVECALVIAISRT